MTQRTSCLRSLIVTAAALALGGCVVVPKQLGEFETDSEGASGATQATGSATSSDPTASGGTVNDSDGPTTDGANDTSGGADTDEPAMLCSEWAAPPAACDIDDGAVGSVTPLVPSGTNEACTVASVVAVDANTESLELTCGGRSYVLAIMTQSPHLALPFSMGQNVTLLVSSPDESQPIGTTLVIQDQDAGPLLVWVSYTSPELDPSAELGPIDVSFSPSGCVGYETATKDCVQGGSIVSQRMVLEFSGDDRSTVIFDGNAGEVLTQNSTFSVIVNAAHRVVCKDDGCLTSSDGPFGEIGFLALAQN